jgi:hypothetical protein
LDKLSFYVAGLKSLIVTRLILWDAYKEEIVEAINT